VCLKTFAESANSFFNLPHAPSAAEVATRCRQIVEDVQMQMLHGPKNTFLDHLRARVANSPACTTLRILAEKNSGRCAV
jgi:hypothetical protein